MIRDEMPVRTRIDSYVAPGNEIKAVHQPYRRSAVGILPLDVGLAIAVEVGGGVDLPGRARVESDIAARQNALAVHQPNCRRAIGVLPENVGPAVAIEVASRLN